MEDHKGYMRACLYENLRDLMLKNVFEKITIKQICDATGVIRATFYNYFDDKYDCLNAIVYHDFVESFHADKISKSLQGEGGNGSEFVPTANSTKLIENNIEYILEIIEKNRSFYRIAYNVTGQNSFEDMIRTNLMIIFKTVLDEHRKPNYLNKYSNNLLARYFAECVAFDIKEFVFQKYTKLTVADTKTMILDLMKNGINDFIQ